MLKSKNKRVLPMMRQTIFKIAAVLFLILLAFHSIFFAFSALVKSVTITNEGLIATSVPQSYWIIGQYANGTYYSTNGQTRINSADPTALINNAMSSGSYVYVEPGSYRLTGTLVPRNNAYLNVSSDAYIYETTPTSLGASFALMMATGSVRNFTVDGGTWDANRGSLRDHRGTSTWNQNYHKYFGIGFVGGGQEITVKNVILQNVIGQGIDLQFVTNSYIYNCSVINAGDNPINIEADSRTFMSNSIIENCYVHGGQDVGLGVWRCSNVTIKNNYVEEVVDYGGASHWSMASEESDYINFIGNTVSNSAYEMVLTTSNNINVIGNTFYGDNGLLDSNQRSTNIYVANNDFSHLTNIRVDLSHSTGVTYYQNIGYP